MSNLNLKKIIKQLDRTHIRSIELVTSTFDPKTRTETQVDPYVEISARDPMSEQEIDVIIKESGEVQLCVGRRENEIFTPIDNVLLGGLLNDISKVLPDTLSIWRRPELDELKHQEIWKHNYDALKEKHEMFKKQYSRKERMNSRRQGHKRLHARIHELTVQKNEIYALYKELTGKKP